MKSSIFNIPATTLAACITLAVGFATAANAAEKAPDLNGVWQFGQCVDGSRMRCMLLEEDDKKLTARAKALRDALDEAAAPKYDCAPMSIPHMWTDPYSHQIQQYDDRIVFTYGKDDVVRTAWLKGHEKGHTPKLNEYSYFGFSIAHYEGATLVVETTHFSFDPQGLNADFRLASSTQKKVVEKYQRDGNDLILEVTTTDPFFLKEPWVYKVRSRRDPEPLSLPWGCEYEGAREILKLMAPKYPQDPAVKRLPD